MAGDDVPDPDPQNGAHVPEVPWTVVCLHGIGGSPGEWEGVASRLVGQVVCLSVPGGSLGVACGRVVAELADRRERTALVGHSRGGVLALMVAAQRPDLVDAVVLSAGYVPPNRAERSWVIGAGSWVKHRGMLVGRFVRRGHLTVRKPDRSASARQSVSAVLEVAGVGLRPSAFDSIARKVECPVLAICGEHDSHVPASWVRGAARRYGWSLATIPGGTHFAHADSPELWADAVEGWLQR